MKVRQAVARRTRLCDLGEDLLVERLTRLLRASTNVISGPGDDAAIVLAPAADNYLVLKTDCVVEQIHFESKTLPEAIGWKAMMRPLSDFAAVSGVPEFALVTLIADRRKEVDWATGIYRGLRRAALRFGVNIVGGETSATLGPASVSVAIVGRVEKERWISRRGGKPGDHLFVTGRLGGSIASKHLRFVPRIKESRWLTANFRIHAMMDLSDGLGADLPRLAAASKLGFEIDRKALPLNRGATIEEAIGDGEDYELLFAVAARDSRRLRERWGRKFARVRLTRIGVLTPQRRARARQEPRRGADRTGMIGNLTLRGGYVHFR